jgi:hypothetical protein
MGETASTWSLPLHSSDTEHHRQKVRESKGKGGAFDINRGERSFPEGLDLNTSVQTSNHNPFDTDSD